MDMDSYRAAIDSSLAAWPRSLTSFIDDAHEGEGAREAFDALAIALEGGKRVRARLAYAGMRCVGEVSEDVAVHTGLALELFQASALIHDDVIDNSSLRRGKPALHAGAAAWHREHAWMGDSAAYGRAAAITLGDVALAGSMDEFARALEYSPSPARAWRLFTAMMMEVGYGQFLDVREEQLPLAATDEAVARAQAIMRHKSARYSVELPLALGACAAGADDELVACLRRIGLAAGMAFQMRDDALGTFGEESTTGKPACGDITEGKRTVLLALTRERLHGEELTYLDSCLGCALSGEDVARVRELMANCGAVGAHEAMIHAYEREAAQALEALPTSCPHVCHAGVEALNSLLEELAERVA